jgi:hypothetical protein
MSIMDDTKKSLFQTKMTIEIDEKWEKIFFLAPCQRGLTGKQNYQGRG